MKQLHTDNLKLKFHANDKVSFKFGRRVLSGVITRLNPKRANIVCEDDQEYQIPYEMLRLLSKQNSDVGKNRSGLELEAIKRLAEKLMAKHNLIGWGFEFDNGSKRAGCCDYRKKVISLSYEYARYALNKEIKNTILHEIAHALVGSKHNHDAVWKAKAIEIGCSGERCHNVEFTPPRYIMKCENNCWTKTAERRRQNIICSSCKGKIIYTTFTEQRWREAFGSNVS